MKKITKSSILWRKNEKNHEIVISIFTVCCIFYMVISMVHAASYSVLAADDFSHGNGVGIFHVSFMEYLLASFTYSKSIYLTWQGTYFSMFLQALLSPINNFGFRQLRCIMAANALMFYVSLIIFAWKALSVNAKEKLHVKLMIIAILVFSFCGFESYPEIFFWFSGATSYSFPLSILLFAIVLFWNTYEKKSTISFVGAIVLGVMAMGGVPHCIRDWMFCGFAFCFISLTFYKKNPRV